MSSEGKKKVRDASTAVQRPVPAEVPPITSMNNRVRSASAWLNREDKLNEVRFKHYLNDAPKITLPVTLKMLQKPLTKVGQEKLEEVTEKLLAPSQPARCTSAQYLDRNGNPLVFYFGRRLVPKDVKKNTKVSPCPYVAARDQYKGQTLEEIEKMAKEDGSLKIIRDGLHEFKCDNYQLAVQSLAADTKLHTLFDDTRHKGKNTMDYTAPGPVSALVDYCSDSNMEDDGDEGHIHQDNSAIFLDEVEVREIDDAAMEDDDAVENEEDAMEDIEQDNFDLEDVDNPSLEENIDHIDEDDDEIYMEAYDTINVDGNGLQKTEQGGVLHLVPGWIQQAQPKKGLFISGDISSTSTSLAAVGSHYALTESVARTIGVAFKTVFPRWYKTYQKAFDAGVWFQDDPGPFLGRAIVYKLQSRLHRDRHDAGPSVSFPVGQFTGGEMVFPQLNLKLQYSPGDFCIFFSSVIYHKVARFAPLPQTAEQGANNITPGRIGSVFFFPRHSLEILKAKPPRWGYRTAFGKNEHLFNRQKKEGVDKS